MAKTQLKTQMTDADVEGFIAAVPDEAMRADCHTLLHLMGRITGAPPRIWGPSIIGFGSTTLQYASGRQLDWFLCGFSPRKAKLSIYLTCDIEQYRPYLDKLGKHSTGKGCLYVKRLSDVDAKVLEKLVMEAVRSTWV